MPVLTRIYAPEDLGILALYVSITAIMSPTMTLRYVAAIPIIKKERRARQLLLMSGIILLSTTIAAQLIAQGLVYFGGNYFFSKSFWISYLWIIPIGSAAIAFYELLTMFTMRRRDYKTIAKSQVVQSLAASVIKIIGGLSGFGSAALIMGQTIQYGSGVITMIRPFRYAMRAAVKEWSVKYLWILAKKYSEFPLYRLPSHFIFSYSSQAPVLLGAFFWSAAEIGQLSVAFLALALPVSLIGQNAGKVYYSELSHITTKYNSILFTKTLSKRLFSSGAVLAVVLVIGGPYAFSFMFGEKWNEAGELARAIAITIPFQLVASTLISAYNIYGNQKKVLLIHGIRAITVTVLILYGAVADFKLVEVMYMYSAIMCLHYSIIWRNVLLLIKIKD